ncbi:MAG: glutamine amidotransferase, partial [Cyanobacteria bacterium J06638_6]
TRAPGTDVKQRCIGNLIAELSPSAYAEMQTMYPIARDLPRTLVGFENHSGQTFLGDRVEPLAKTITGFGNNASAEYEGARYKNVFGSYMHGSLLPKNPHFADYLIWLALCQRYPEAPLTLPALADAEELAAHNYVVQRYGT